MLLLRRRVGKRIKKHGKQLCHHDDDNTPHTRWHTSCSTTSQHTLKQTLMSKKAQQANSCTSKFEYFDGAVDLK